MSDDNQCESTIDIGSGSLGVSQRGDGRPALVFLHYWGGSGRTWRPVIDRLADTARCVAIDQRGWGRSTALAADHSMGRLADDALAVIERLALDDYVLVGHSMGGKVAQVLAARRPVGLRGVVLVAPAPARPLAVPVAVRAQMADAYLSRDAVLATLDGVLRHAELSEELRDQVVADGLAGTPEAKRDWPAAGILQDVSDGLSEIDVPVAVLVGREDLVEPPEVMTTHVLAAIPGARLEVIERCGHLMPLERPAELADRVRAFLRMLAIDRTSPPC